MSFFELFTSSLFSIDLYSDGVGVYISLNNSSSLSFLNVYAPPICCSSTDCTTASFFPSLLPFRNLYSWGLQLPSLLWDSKGTSDARREEVFNWIISSDLHPLSDPDISTLLHCSSGSPFSLAFSCSWEVLQDLGSDHLLIVLTAPLSLAFRPNEHLLQFSESSLGRLSFLLRLLLSLYKGILVSSAAALF